jgi:hypothetical protein
MDPAVRHTVRRPKHYLVSVAPSGSYVHILPQILGAIRWIQGQILGVLQQRCTDSTASQRPLQSQKILSTQYSTMQSIHILEVLSTFSSHHDQEPTRAAGKANGVRQLPVPRRLSAEADVTCLRDHDLRHEAGSTQVLKQPAC